jgi:hypothetical protein
MKESSTVRIDAATQALLKQLAKQENESMRLIIKKALESYRRKLFLQKCSDAYEDLKTDKKAWKKELSEREDWDSTTTDGLEQDS